MTDYMIQFGDIFLAELVGDGHTQGGIRPVIIVQNNIGNLHAPTTEVIPLSARTNKASHLPTHVTITPNEENGLNHASVAVAEQTTTIDKRRLKRRLGVVDHSTLIRIGHARRIQSPFPTE